MRSTFWSHSLEMEIWNFELAWCSPGSLPFVPFDGWGLCDSSTGEPRCQVLLSSQAFRCLGREWWGIRKPWRTVRKPWRSGSRRGRGYPHGWLWFRGYRKSRWCRVWYAGRAFGWEAPHAPLFVDHPRLFKVQSLKLPKKSVKHPPWKMWMHASVHWSSSA